MTDCPYCKGRGWFMVTHDPDTDMDCPYCERTSK